MKKTQKVWFVILPAFLYAENIKELARKAGLKIVDAKYQGDAAQCENPPKITLVSESEKAPVLEAALDQLKVEADNLGVEYGAGIGYDTLFKRVAEAKG